MWPYQAFELCKMTKWVSVGTGVRNTGKHKEMCVHHLWSIAIRTRGAGTQGFEAERFFHGTLSHSSLHRREVISLNIKTLLRQSSKDAQLVHSLLICSTTAFDKFVLLWLQIEGKEHDMEGYFWGDPSKNSFWISSLCDYESSKYMQLGAGNRKCSVVLDIVNWMDQALSWWRPLKSKAWSLNILSCGTDEVSG